VGSHVNIGAKRPKKLSIFCLCHSWFILSGTRKLTHLSRQLKPSFASLTDLHNWGCIKMCKNKATVFILKMKGKRWNSLLTQSSSHILLRDKLRLKWRSVNSFTSKRKKVTFFTLESKKYRSIVQLDSWHLNGHNSTASNVKIPYLVQT